MTQTSTPASSDGIVASQALPHAVMTLLVQMIEAVEGRRNPSPASSVYSPTTCDPSLVRALCNQKRRRFFGQDGSWNRACAEPNSFALDNPSVRLEPGSALARDAFPPALLADLAIAMLPLDPDAATVATSNADGRWTYGSPPSARNDYAWLQQTLFHLTDGGFAFLVAPTGMLVSTHVAEFPIRQALVSEGRVYASIALPGRLFPASNAVAHILALGPRRSSDHDRPTLFVDAQELGVEHDGTLARSMGEDLVRRIARTFERFMAKETVQELRFAVMAQPLDIEERNCDLVASSFVFTPERATSQDPTVVARGTRELARQLAENKVRFDELDASLAKILGRVIA